ncbi:hypothetical protein HDU78_009585, partial [Chytriomyces hyalinus]
GKTVDFSKNDCPLADKCPYYKDAKEKGADGGCPATKGCPHFNKDIPASGDVKKCPYHQKGAEKDAKAGGCPLHQKCPYVDKHHAKHGEGCPLEKGGCPYYSEHKDDKDIAKMLSHEGGCPLKEKCPYYEDMKSGKKVDFSGNKCPLAEKCPYYKEVKQGDFKKDFEKGGHAHHGGKGDSHDSKDCPYLKKHAKASEKVEKAKGHDEL